MNYDKELTFAKELAVEAGQIMRRYFRADDIGTEWKSDDTPVTAGDLAINQMVIDRVKTTFPAHGILGEENSFEPDRNLIWVVDPIDGTMPFSLGIQVSTFLLALVDRSDGQPVVAVIYDPYLDEMYTAVKDAGAFLNGKRIETLKSASLRNTYAAIYGPVYSDEQINYTAGRVIDELKLKKCNALKFASGAYTGARIATGQFVLLVMANGKPWDSAAPALVVQEAGGAVTDLKGDRRRFDEESLGCVIVANDRLLPEVLQIIKGE